MIAFEVKYLRSVIIDKKGKMLDLVFRYTVIYYCTETISTSWASRRILIRHAIEQLAIECRKTKVITITPNCKNANNAAQITEN